jgi:hypothetical protein
MIAISSRPRRVLRPVRVLPVRPSRQMFRVRLSRQALLLKGRSGIPSTGIGMMRPVLRQLREPRASRLSQRFSRVPNRQARFPQAKSGLPSTGTGTTHRNDALTNRVRSHRNETQPGEQPDLAKS